MQHEDGMDIATKDARESELLDEKGQPSQPHPIVLDTRRKLGRGPIIGGVLAALVLGVFNYELRSADAQEKLLNDTVTAYESAVELTQDRFEGGAAPQSDLAQARTQLDQARA